MGGQERKITGVWGRGAGLAEEERIHASEHPDANESSSLFLDFAEEDTVSLWVMQKVKSGPHS